MLLLNILKFFLMLVMTVKTAFQGFIYVNTINIQQDKLKILKVLLDFKHSADLPYKHSDCLMRFGNERELISHLPVHETT
ncbi:hypothetical protein GH733_003734 [Mirounga leonina]|nr:hypothetical protein GH733_003734 [Mirounga leonina]